MSLINEVLRELEAKRPDDLARQKLQREIRALPPVRHRKQRWWWLIPACLLLSLAGAAYYFKADRQSPPPQQASVPSVTNAILPPVQEKHGEPPVDKLRLAFELSVPPLPEQTAASASPPAAQASAPLLKPADTSVAPAAPPPSKNEPERVASGVVRIDKSPVAATPRDLAEIEARKAEQAMSGGRVAEAIDAWQAALRHDPAFIAPRQALVAQLLAQRRLMEVARLLEEGLALQPGQTPWVMTLARVQLEQGGLAKADETLARFQNQALHLPEYAGFQGHLKSRLGAHAEAIAHYSRAVRMAPGEGRWWLGLGLELQADGKAADAKEAFRRALATSNLSAELAAVAQQQIQN